MFIKAVHSTQALQAPTSFNKFKFIDSTTIYVRIGVVDIYCSEIRKKTYTLTQNKNRTLFILGFTIPEIKTPVPPNVGNEIQSCVGMLNFISWGVSL